MRRICGLLVLYSLLDGVVGCGGGVSQPPPAQCNGIAVSGTLVDSLSGAAVTSAAVDFETGKAGVGVPVFGFSVVKSTNADANGKFQFCVPSAPHPSAVIVAALDAGGNAYPALVAPVTSSIDFGRLLMGICRGTCFNGQQQTSSPAVIEGAITTAPVAKSGSVFAQSGLVAPDDFTKVWVISLPLLEQAETNSFQTNAGTCAGGAPFCAHYSFTVPSQNPIVHTASGYTQLAGEPNYMIYATPDGGSCIPPFGFTAFQEDGTSFLTGSPGVHLTAAAIAFQSCQ